MLGIHRDNDQIPHDRATTTTKDPATTRASQGLQRGQVGSVSFPDTQTHPAYYYPAEQKIYFDSLKGSSDNIWTGDTSCPGFDNDESTNHFMADCGGVTAHGATCTLAFSAFALPPTELSDRAGIVLTLLLTTVATDCPTDAIEVQQ